MTTFTLSSREAELIRESIVVHDWNHVAGGLTEIIEVQELIDAKAEVREVEERLEQFGGLEPITDQVTVDFDPAYLWEKATDELRSVIEEFDTSVQYDEDTLAEYRKHAENVVVMVDLLGRLTRPVPNRLESLRKASGESREALSEALGRVDPSRIAAWEADFIPTDYQEALAKHFGVSVAHLLSHDERSEVVA